MTQAQRKFLCNAYVVFTLLLGMLGLFLSAWIVLPAPIFPLLVLSIGAPEVSPWLFFWNLAAVSLALVGLRASSLARWALALGVLGLLLSALPLLQLPATEARLDAQMESALGRNFQSEIPAATRAGWRSAPFIPADSFWGIAAESVRFRAGIEFAAPANSSLRLDVYQPPRVGRYPALVVLYGGSWQQGNPSLNAEFSRYLAARGWVVLAIDYRHAPTHRFPAQIVDVRSALAFIRREAARFEVDPDRLVLLGRSAGAHLALLAAYENGAVPVRAVVSYYGPIFLADGYRDPPSPDPLDVRRVLETFLGGTPDTVPEQYRLASPGSYVDRPQPPTLLVYGGRDNIVELKFGVRLYERLRATGSTAVLIDIPWANHGFDSVFQGPSNQLALYYTERFLAWAVRPNPNRSGFQER